MESKEVVDLKLFPCDCQDPGCFVLVINDDYNETVYAEFPVCIAASSKTGFIKKFLRADDLYRRGSILFQSVPTVIDEYGEPILDEEASQKKRELQRLVYQFIKARGKLSLSDTWTLCRHGVVLCQKINIDPKSKNAFIRYIKLNNPKEMLHDIFEWLSLPIFFIVRLMFLLLDKYQIVADCIIKKDELKEYAKNVGIDGFIKLADSMQSTEEDGRDLREIWGTKEVTLNMKFDSALHGVAIQRMQCYFYKDGTSEYRII